MKKHPPSKLIIVIIIALFVPILTYTIYQFTQRDENEQLIKSIYDRQLESILFSLNQYCWDIFNNWQSEMTSAAAVGYENFSNLHNTPKIQDIIDAQRSLTSALLRFSKEYFVIVSPSAPDRPVLRREEMLQKVNQIIEEAQPALERSRRLAIEGYIRPYAVHWQVDSLDETLLLFPIIKTGLTSSPPLYGALVIDNTVFVERIVARRFKAISDGEFILAIRNRKSDQYLYYSTETPPQEPFEQSAALWILPDIELNLKMAGTTLATLSQNQVRKNLILLLAVNIVILVGLVYIIRNVSKEMELAKIKSNLVANVSHEIRTPIALIRLYAETLQSGRLQDEQKKQKYYKTMLAESIHLTQLVNNMLDFSKIESKKKEYSKSPNDLGKLVRQVLEMYYHNFEQQGFKVECDVAPDLPLVNIDVEAVTQAFVNLIDNAMKYSSNEKYIYISVEQTNKHIILAVSDKGIGIPEAEHKKIFQKFYRVGDSLLHTTKGSGLGLSLVEHIMSIHEGKVTVKSAVGQGSTFTLHFPIIKNGV